MTCKHVHRGTFGQKENNWFSYWKSPEGCHVLSQSSKVTGSVTTIGRFATKRELTAKVNELQIESA